MSDKYNNVFQGVLNSVRGTPLSAWMLIMSVMLFIIGINNFAEDTYSSYAGVQMIENVLNMKPASWQFTYWAMSLFFQVISVIFFFIYLSDRKENWNWFWFGMATQFLDFMADVWYRSNEQLFSSPTSFAVSFLLTFVFFTFGSEFAITLGFGLTAVLFKDGMVQLVKVIKSIFDGISEGLKEISSTGKSNAKLDYGIDPAVEKRRQEFHNNRHKGNNGQKEETLPLAVGGSFQERELREFIKRNNTSKKLRQPLLQQNRNRKK